MGRDKNGIENRGLEELIRTTHGHERKVGNVGRKGCAGQRGIRGENGTTGIA